MTHTEGAAFGLSYRLWASEREQNQRGHHGVAAQIATNGELAASELMPQEACRSLGSVGAVLDCPQYAIKRQRNAQVELTKQFVRTSRIVGLGVFALRPHHHMHARNEDDGRTSAADSRRLYSGADSIL